MRLLQGCHKTDKAFLLNGSHVRRRNSWPIISRDAIKGLEYLAKIFTFVTLYAFMLTWGKQARERSQAASFSPASDLPA